MESNALRFINAYNQIDQTLRAVYNFKRNITFSDMIRRAVSLNSIVRRYEDKLIDYARLRNAIIHNSNEERIIAEPHDDVVEEIYDYFRNEAASDSLSDAMEELGQDYDEFEVRLVRLKFLCEVAN